MNSVSIVLSYSKLRTPLLMAIQISNQSSNRGRKTADSSSVVVWRSHTHNAQNRERVWCRIILRLVPVKKSDKRMNIVK